MSEFNKYSTDGGATFINVEDSNAVHWGDQSKGYVVKNVIPFPYNDNRIEGDRINMHNVEYTIYSDGRIKANGTATGNGGFSLLVSTESILENGKEYILSDGGVGKTHHDNEGKTVGVYIQKRQTPDSGSGDYATTYNGEGTFTVDNTTYPYIMIGIWVQSGAVFNNEIIYPMIRLASIPDSTYEPWYMSNRELTQEIKYKSGDTIVLNDLMGHITSGASQIQLFLHGKFDTSISSVSISGSDIRIRGCKGYVKDNNGVEMGGVSFSTYLKLSNWEVKKDYLYIIIQNTSSAAFQNVDNNTPLSFWGDPITITLA